MEILQAWLDASDMPAITAFLLGLLTATSPCPLATNITAIGFISKDIEDKQRILLHGILYAIGRIVAYSLLGILLIYMLRGGIDTFNLQSSISRWGELLVAPLLLIIGVLMLVDRAERLRGKCGALLLGMLFAMAFCPTSGLFYFGMLIPMSASASGGYVLPVIYALATGLPVVGVAWMIAYSVANIAGFYKKMQVCQQWLNRLVAILFITVGLYYAYTFYL